MSRYKKYYLNFHSRQGAFFYVSVLVFVIRLIVIIKQTSNSLKIKNGAVVKYPEMLKFFPDDLKSRKMCKHPVKKLLFLIQYVLDRY